MAEQQGLPDTWAAGDAFEPYIGRWSRLVVRDFVAWLVRLPRQRWLDVGCGTGALTQTILANAEPAEVTGVDPSEGFLATAAQAGVGPVRKLSHRRCSETAGR